MEHVTSQRGEGYTRDAPSAPRQVKVRGAVLEKDGQSSPANDHPISNLQFLSTFFYYYTLDDQVDRTTQSKPKT